MVYTLAETHEKIRQFADKMGSDYFPLPVILNFFQTATYDFIGERLKHVELTQEITDDIRPLIISRRVIVSSIISNERIAPGEPPSPIRYGAGIPANYLRTVSYDVIYDNNERCRRADMVSNSEYRMAIHNPNKSPTKQYPLITQEDNLFVIDSGSAIARYLYLTYCKKPTIATTGQPDARIVNLPDDAIEKILMRTVILLFNRSEDSRTQTTFQLEESFRKVFK